MAQSTTRSFRSNEIKTWISMRPALSFYLLTLLPLWGYWLTLLALGLRVEPESLVTLFPGLLGPLLAAQQAGVEVNLAFPLPGGSNASVNQHHHGANHDR